MLTAAVVGDVFASPPAEAVMAAIRAVGSAGALLIGTNYTGMPFLHMCMHPMHACSSTVLPQCARAGADILLTQVTA